MTHTGRMATIWRLKPSSLTVQMRIAFDDAMQPRRVAGIAFAESYPEFFMSSEGEWRRMGPDGDWRTSSLSEAAEVVFQ